MLGVVKWIIAYVSNAKLAKKQIGCYLLSIFFYKEFTVYFGYMLFN